MQARECAAGRCARDEPWLIFIIAGFMHRTGLAAAHKFRAGSRQCARGGDVGGQAHQVTGVLIANPDEIAIILQQLLLNPPHERRAGGNLGRDHVIFHRQRGRSADPLSDDRTGGHDAGRSEGNVCRRNVAPRKHEVGGARGDARA